MRLYVMRHGPAEDRAATGRDFDRALTRPGREIVDRAARGLRRAREAESTSGGGRLSVLSSPLRRARETAEIVRGVLSSPAAPIEVELHDDLATDRPLPFALIFELARTGGDALLIGHQPAVEALVDMLAAPAAVPLPGGFHTGLIVTLESAGPGRWQPAAVFDPREANR